MKRLVTVRLHGWLSGLNGPHVTFNCAECCGCKPHMGQHCIPQIIVLSLGVVCIRYIFICKVIIFLMQEL